MNNKKTSTVEDTLSYNVIGCALEVYKALGPGLLETVYEKALMLELQRTGIHAENQVPFDINYKGETIGDGLRLDILVEKSLIVELKSVETLLPVHFKQLLTYLKLTGKQVGLLINFNENNLMKGIHRVVNNF
ncbi:MAG: GxxExxY protein [Alloprevotella sp.]